MDVDIAAAVRVAEIDIGVVHSDAGLVLITMRTNRRTVCQTSHRNPTSAILIHTVSRHRRMTEWVLVYR